MMEVRMASEKDTQMAYLEVVGQKEETGVKKVVEAC
jgi:hypothetical protein